jgi:hypothetical protein
VIIVWKFSNASSRPCAISAWYGVAVIAHADVAAHHAVLPRNALQLRQRLALAQWRWQVQLSPQPNRCRHRLVDQFIHGRKAQRAQHGCALGLVRADVPAGKSVQRAGSREVHSS